MADGLRRCFAPDDAAATSVSALRSDQRGAILVPALVMGALMTGALFYVAAVGDAVMFRTQLQDAADVTAFHDAVWHARGMNTIASLNLLMTAALAIFAVLRMARIIMFFIPVLNAASGALQGAEQGVFRFLDIALKGLEGAEQGVSAAVPYIGFFDAKNTPTAADTIWPLSVSMIPPLVTAPINPDHVRIPTRMPAALPIEAGTFGELCGKAAMAVPNQIMSVIETRIPGWAQVFVTGRVRSFLNMLIDDVGPKAFGAMDGIFCQPVSGMASSLLGFLNDQVCDRVDRATAQHDQQDQQANEEAERQEQDNRNGQQTTDNRPQTVDDGRAGGAQQADGSNGRRPARGGGPANACGGEIGQGVDDVGRAAKFTSRPAIIWSSAKNGNVAMHVWSWAQGQPRLFRATQQGISIADKGRMPAVTPDDSAVAMSEFYFDCETAWTFECLEDAPWAPNWTARMRRFRDPLLQLQRVGLDTVTGLLDALEQSVGDHMNELTGEIIHNFTGFPVDNPVSRWIGDKVNEIPLVRQISDRVSGAVSSAREASGIDQLLDPRRLADQDRIH